jgi:2-hydroxychromene-2-carboxylate isomerase
VSGRRLDFYFDYSSPFAYLASVDVGDVAKGHDAELVHRPILLGGLFKAIGTPLVPIAEMSEAKRSYQKRDMQRWARERGVDLIWPSRFPLRTVKPLRMTLLAEEAQRPALIESLMRACWAEDRDPDDDDVLRECAKRAGVDEALVDQTRTDEVKAALRAATEEAIERGVFGVPTFIVDEQLFWGQDRLDFVEQALDGWRPL